MQPNPFSTRYIQPGAISYECFEGGNVTRLAERIVSLPSKRGSIIGPHGSGKSTLVASLVSEIGCIKPQYQIHQLRFSTDRSASRSLHKAVRKWTRGSIAILDGYEQLKVWSRVMVEWTARSRSVCILATAHQPIRGFETIWETSVNESSSRWVVEKLLQQSGSLDEMRELLQSDDWARSRAKHGQNLRESLFDMYDWWQQKAARRSPP